MNVKTRGLFFVFIFFCLAGALFGQADGGPLKHRIAWTKDDYALRYEVIIEKEEKNEYSPVLREFTEEPFIFISLPPGNYRLRVVSYDFRDIPGGGTAWKNFRVVHGTGADSESRLVMDDAAENQAENQNEDITLTLPEKHSGLYVGLFAEGLGYSRYGAAFGGGVAFGGSFNGMGAGLTLLYAQDAENFIFMEALAHFRMYLSRLKNNTGFFLQAEGGIVLFAYEKLEITEYGSLSAGLGAGWRFPLGTRWYIEPCVRVGYPYILGVSLTAGMRFD